MTDQDDDKTQTYIVLSRGTMVAHYRIVEKIGAGGMGEVYLAEDTKLQRRVALKFLPHHLVDDSDIRARFIREAQAAAKLSHPNIITIYEVGDIDNRPFFAMEYVTGHSLDDYFRKSKHSICETIGLAIQICEGLGKAHQSGVIHRDIKPGNIVVDADSRLKILDFGLASVQGADKLTKTGSTLGTIAYMSPEQAQGKLADHRSDIFSFGVVLYEMVTGKPPFKRESDAATLQAIVTDMPEPLARFRVNVPDELQRIVTKLLERDPALRYQSANDVIADLKKLAIADSSLRMTPIASRNSRTRIYAAAIATIALIAAATFFLRTSHHDGLTNGALSFTPLTDDGNAYPAAISPSGSYVAFVEQDHDLYSLWVKNIPTSSKVQVALPSRLIIQDVAFSPDGNSLYYCRLDSSNVFNLYMVPVLGGNSRLEISNVLACGSFSPDRARMSFIRPSTKSGKTDVVVADNDGSNERVLASGVFDIKTSWSPNGKCIAVSKLITAPPSKMELVLLDAVSGQEIWHGSTILLNIDSFCWLPDGKGFIVAAGEPSNPFGKQLWRMEYPSGALRRISNDLVDYNAITISSDGRQLVAVQRDSRSGVWIAPMNDPANMRQVLFGRYDGMFGLSWVDSNSFTYFSRAENYCTLMRYEISNKESDLIVTGDPLLRDQAVSHNGTIMVYQYWSRGKLGIMICNISGRNGKQITAPDGVVFCPQIAPDGRWVAYMTLETNGNYKIVRLSVDLKDTVIISENPFSSGPLSISPDGRYIACYEGIPFPGGVKYRIAIYPGNGGKAAGAIELPNDLPTDAMVWSTDAKSIFFVNKKDGCDNIWRAPIDGGPMVQLTHYAKDSGMPSIRGFDLSHDGKMLAICRGSFSNDVVLIRGFGEK